MPYYLVLMTLKQLQTRKIVNLRTEKSVAIEQFFATCSLALKDKHEFRENKKI